MKNETMFIDAENDVAISLPSIFLYRVVEPFVYLLHAIVDKMHKHIINSNVLVFIYINAK